VATADGRNLQAANNGAITLPFAAQRVALVPGGYKVTISGAVPPGALFASLSCRREFEHAGPVAVRAGAAELAYSGPCGAPWLQLWLAPSSGPVVLQRVDLERR
jgi:hypothetical protein